MTGPAKRIFVSYAHEDKKWADALSTFLAPWLRQSRVRLWDDRQIVAGADWESEIDAAIEEASVAVLLVTAHFFSSDFITRHELPAILRRADARQLKVLWIAVSPALYETSELMRFQAANSPAHPLTSLNKPRREEALVRIAKHIADAATLESLAMGLKVIDQTTESLEAALDKRPESSDRTFGIEAEYDPGGSQIEFKGSSAVITVADLEKLDPKDREFIADLEDSLDRNYGRWSSLRSGLGNAGGALDGEIEQQLDRVSKLMCADLTSILDFVRAMYKAELEDHYGRYRFICARLHST